MVIQELQEIVKKRIREKTDHTYLQAHLPNPIVDDNKLLLTISLLLEAKLNERDIIVYATTITLVQIALDTHELVTNDRMQMGSEIDRQLTVLAGDLYSGQYYKLLANVEDIKMLRYLAQGIKEVNENKINFYHQNAKNVSQVIDLVKNIEASLIKKLGSYFYLDEWNAFIEEFLFLNRLEIEQNNYIHSNQSKLVDILNDFESDKLEKNMVLDKYKKMTLSQLEKHIQNIPKINKQLKEKVDQLFNINSQQQMYVEEG